MNPQEYIFNDVSRIECAVCIFILKRELTEGIWVLRHPLNEHCQYSDKRFVARLISLQEHVK